MCPPIIPKYFFKWQGNGVGKGLVTAKSGGAQGARCSLFCLSWPILCWGMGRVYKKQDCTWATRMALTTISSALMNHGDACPHTSGLQSPWASYCLSDTWDAGLHTVPITPFQTIFMVLKGREIIFYKLLCTDLRNSYTLFLKLQAYRKIKQKVQSSPIPPSFSIINILY